MDKIVHVVSDGVTCRHNHVRRRAGDAAEYGFFYVAFLTATSTPPWNPTRHGAVPVSTGPQCTSDIKQKTPVLPGLATVCLPVQALKMTPTGSEHIQESSGKQHFSKKAEVKSEASAEIAEILAAWPNLRAGQRGKVLKIIRAAKGG